MKKFTLLSLFLISFIVNSQTLTHSVSQTLITGNSGACIDFSLGIRDNIYFRAFNLNSFGINTNYQVSAIEFGVEDINTDIETGFPVTVRLYSTSGAFPVDFPDGHTEIGSVVVELLTQSLTMITVPFDVIITPDQTLVVAIEIPSTDGSFFQLGSNNLGQTAPSYISSQTCGLINPIDLASAGFGQMHSVINVIGQADLSVYDHQSELVSIFPNPTSDFINIYLSDATMVEKVMIADIAGKYMEMPLIQGNKIDISKFASGVYMLNIQTQSGNEVLKIVKL